MAIDVEKEVIKTTLRIRDIRNMEDDDARQVEKVVAVLVTRAVAEAKRDTVEKACCMAVCSNGCNQRIRAAFADLGNSSESSNSSPETKKGIDNATML